MNEQEETALLKAGWKMTHGSSHGYVCRMCHREVIYGTPAWCSPGYTWYHPSCAKKSPSVQKAIKQAQGEGEGE